MEVEIDGGRIKKAISAQETSRDPYSGSLIRSFQGHDLLVCAGGRRANGATFIYASVLRSPSLWKWEDNCMNAIQCFTTAQIKSERHALLSLTDK